METGWLTAVVPDSSDKSWPRNYLQTGRPPDSPRRRIAD
jgi:hypothetical protein